MQAPLTQAMSVTVAWCASQDSCANHW
jgi:hypothetical protein